MVDEANFNEPVIVSAEDDTVEIVTRADIPDEMAECIYDALCLGRRMRRSGGFYVSHCPFHPDSELAIAWKAGFFDTSVTPSRFVVERKGKVNWKCEGF